MSIFKRGQELISFSTNFFKVIIFIFRNHFTIKFVHTENEFIFFFLHKSIEENRSKWKKAVANVML